MMGNILDFAPCSSSAPGAYLVSHIAIVLLSENNPDADFRQSAGSALRGNGHHRVVALLHLGNVFAMAPASDTDGETKDEVKFKLNACDPVKMRLTGGVPTTYLPGR